MVIIITYKIHLLRTGATGGGDAADNKPAKRTNERLGRAEHIKKYIGQSDIPLCADGESALKALMDGSEYPRADIVFTSPLLRCVQTAGILYPDAFTVNEEGLMDMNLGVFEGKTFVELKDNEDFIKWLDDSSKNPPPGGEKADAFTRRVLEAVNRMFTKMMNEKLTNAAAITHGGVIMTILASIGLPKLPMHHWAVGNGCGYTILMTPQMWMRDRACEVFSAQPLQQLR